MLLIINAPNLVLVQPFLFSRRGPVHTLGILEMYHVPAIKRLVLATTQYCDKISANAKTGSECDQYRADSEPVLAF